MTAAQAPVRIGFVNNMPDGAFVLAERQFQRLIDSSLPEGMSESIRFVLPALPRGDLCRAEITRRYLPIGRLGEFALDAVIVTGAEPGAADLRDEAFWQELVYVIEHLARHEIASVFSCLAAHAVVLHLDGIPRIRLQQKCCGVFAHTPDLSHPLMTEAGPNFLVPHSRRNGLDAELLIARGYHIASRRGPEVDVFTHAGHGHMLFLQGHPEYDGRTLLLEYHRDICRFASGECQAWPAMPQHSFDEDSEQRLKSIEERVAFRNPADSRNDATAVLKSCRPAQGWADDAKRLFRNWFASVPAAGFYPAMAERQAR